MVRASYMHRAFRMIRQWPFTRVPAVVVRLKDADGSVVQNPTIGWLNADRQASRQCYVCRARWMRPVPFDSLYISGDVARFFSASRKRARFCSFHSVEVSGSNNVGS